MLEADLDFHSREMFPRDPLRWDRMSFQVIGKSELCVLSPVEPYLLIQIGFPGEPPEMVSGNPFCLGTIRVEFADDLLNSPGNDLLSIAQAQEIVSFVRPYMNTAKLIVCQCGRGQNRSPAIAAALSYVINGDDRVFHEAFQPTRSAYSVLLKVANNTYSRGGLIPDQVGTE